MHEKQITVVKCYFKYQPNSNKLSSVSLHCLPLCNQTLKVQYIFYGYETSLFLPFFCLCLLQQCKPRIPKIK